MNDLVIRLRAALFAVAPSCWKCGEVAQYESDNFEGYITYACEDHRSSLGDYSIDGIDDVIALLKEVDDLDTGN